MGLGEPIYLLLLLGLAQAHHGPDYGSESETPADRDDAVDLTSTIMRMNNDSREFLVEGDVWIPRTRSAMRCFRKASSCLWPKSEDGTVRVPFVLSDKYVSTFNFKKQDTNNMDLPYDYSSIMHYGRTAFTTRPGQETITPIPDETIAIGQRQGMSDLDFRKLNKLYKCSVACSAKRRGANRASCA